MCINIAYEKPKTQFIPKGTPHQQLISFPFSLRNEEKPREKC